ncbi:DnaJ domain protein [Theileria parva strain Muguga]|uniref:DnaJ domain protein n=1 Tax=Theileria parva strain Muguga TaxID=333668 RepID=UPI001C61A5AC|nr:DnaJ domain protein [Theileria parva strain Muguga]KAF5153077.1 DnaJ domain protein [Theileria parva strain Muguga]
MSENDAKKTSDDDENGENLEKTVNPSTANDSPNTTENPPDNPPENVENVENPLENVENPLENVENKANDAVDEMLKLFYEEINTLSGKVEYDNKNIKLDSKGLILRLTSQTFSSPYQVLQLKPDATEEDIKQRYHKLSLLVHPDKCKHDKAPQAFQVLKDAYNEIKKVDIREKYKEIYEDARKIVYKRHKIKLDTTQLELYSMGRDVDLKSFEGEIEKECVNILNKQQERREYAENCIKANIQYEKNIQSNLMNLEKEKLQHQVEWDKTRDLRVNSWKSFQSKMVGLAPKGVTVRKEENRDINVNKSIINLQSNRINKRKKIIDTTQLYKQNWK